MRKGGECTQHLKCGHMHANTLGIDFQSVFVSKRLRERRTSGQRQPGGVREIEKFALLSTLEIA